MPNHDEHDDGEQHDDEEGKGADDDADVLLLEWRLFLRAVERVPAASPVPTVSSHHQVWQVLWTWNNTRRGNFWHMLGSLYYCRLTMVNCYTIY